MAWKAYKPSEQETIRRYPADYLPAGPIYRIASYEPEEGYVGLLFKSHPNEPDPTWEQARLIAAAPTLLEACEGVLDILQEFTQPDDEPMQDAIKVLRQAIREAQGEVT